MIIKKYKKIDIDDLQICNILLYDNKIYSFGIILQKDKYNNYVTILDIKTSGQVSIDSNMCLDFYKNKIWAKNED